jgi:hypothetical protein
VIDSWRSPQGSSVGRPPDIVISIRTVGTGESLVGSATSAKAGTKSVTGASSTSCPASRSASSAAAVKLFVQEAIR